MIAIRENRFLNKKTKVWSAHFMDLHNVPHWHDAIELIFCESKTCNVRVENQIIKLKENETAVIESGHVHSISTAPNGKTFVILASNELFKGITNKYKLVNVKQQKYTDIPSYYNFYKKEIKNEKIFSNIILHAKIRELVATIYRDNPIIPCYNENYNKKYSLLKEVLNTIESDFAFITFENMAHKAGYSPAHFSRLFTSIIGMTFTKYLNLVKIEHAIEAIQSSPKRSITSVSIDCGFSSIRTFNRTFKQLTGYTPSTIPKSFSFEELRNIFTQQYEDPTQSVSVILDE